MSDLLPIGTEIECPGALEPRPPLIKRMCARCQLVLGWVVCTPAQSGQITHGSCDACVEIQLADLVDWRANQAALALAVEYSLDVGDRHNRHNSSS